MNILIVDDEEDILEEIKSLAVQCTTFANNVFSTKDGSEALNIIENQKIDILVSDIRMPVYDGFYLATQLKSKNPSAHIIFISAYDDKEYLKSALSLRADSYFEKPINQSDFTKQLTATIQTVAVETSLHSISTLTEMKLLFKYLVADEDTSARDEHSFSKTINENGYFLPVALKAYSSNPQLEMNRYLLQSLRQYPFHDPSLQFCLYENHPSSFSIIFYGEAINRTEIAQMFDNICKSNDANINFIIAVGNVVNKRAAVRKEYLDAVTNLEYGFYCNYGIIKPASILAGLAEATVVPSKEIAVFGEMLQKGNTQDVLSFVQQLYKRIKDAKMPSSSAQYLIQQLLNKLYFFAEEHHLFFSLSFEEISNLQFHLFTEMQEYFNEQLQRFFGEYSRNDYVINRIKSYIAANYSDSALSVQSITQSLNLNNSYACSHFKKHTKMTINEYISRMRLNEAKRLIIAGDLTINEIALQVGYKDPNYFYRFFKKTVGMTALEYKNSFMSQSEDKE